ncbi:signal peptidase I [Granulicoccus phenolivorans]|uniref:signal peptidase I n=1 Tax=Granulicoccus phenolivorans TaxID=266854 RepID=UPI000A4C3E5E|nr:signal peptidase I [Granulicoccus phenolivorans]
MSQRSDGTWPGYGEWDTPQPESTGSPQEPRAAHPFRPEAVDQTTARDEEITNARGMPPVPPSDTETTLVREPADDRTLPAAGTRLPHAAPGWTVADATLPPPPGVGSAEPGTAVPPDERGAGRGAPIDPTAGWAPPGQQIPDPGPPTVVRGAPPIAEHGVPDLGGGWHSGASGITRPTWYEPRVTDQPASAPSAAGVEAPPPLSAPRQPTPPAAPRQPAPSRPVGRVAPPPEPAPPEPAPAGSAASGAAASGTAPVHAEDLSGWQGWVARRVRDNKLNQHEDQTPEEEPRTAGQKVLGAAKEIVIVVILALIASGLFRGFVYQVFEVPSGSMELTLAIGDKIAVQKFGGYERGDVVVFEDAHGWLADGAADKPPDPDLLRQGLELVGLAADSGQGHLVKRVIGLPGDRVTCCDVAGRVEVNGYPLDESFTYAEEPAAGQIPFEVVVPEDRLFVLGDHRNASGDSRCHLNGGQPRGNTAFIPRSRVTGKVVMIVLPVNRFQRLARPATFDAIPAAQQQPPPEPVVTDPIGAC